MLKVDYLPRPFPADCRGGGRPFDFEMTKCFATKARRHKVTTKILKPLTQKEEDVGKAVVNAAFTVHKELGPGLLERVYEVCLCHELVKKGLSIKGN